MGIANALAALGGATMVLAGIRVIFGTGKVVRGQEQLERSFNDHREEARLDNSEFRKKFEDHGVRLAVLEAADRRHLIRRHQDQALRDNGSGS